LNKNKSSISTALKLQAQAVVDYVMKEVKGVQAVVIATDDGFEVAARVENVAEVSRLSAMSSSLAALGVLAGAESRLGGCEVVMVKATSGMLIILPINRSQGGLIMSVVTTSEAIAGQVLYFSQQAAATLQQDDQ
jgi:predicted regulator of Ras-like GTPase activity (Roadblock/LC7/MglB family)